MQTEWRTAAFCGYAAIVINKIHPTLLIADDLFLKLPESARCRRYENTATGFECRMLNINPPAEGLPDRSEKPGANPGASPGEWGLTADSRNYSCRILYCWEPPAGSKKLLLFLVLIIGGCELTISIDLLFRLCVSSPRPSLWSGLRAFHCYPAAIGL